MEVIRGGDEGTGALADGLERGVGASRARRPTGPSPCGGHFEPGPVPLLQDRQLRVDPQRAREVAAAFAVAHDAPDDPLVRSAYSSLGDQAQRWFHLLTGDRARRPVRVLFTRRAEPYADASELRRAIRDDRVLEVGSVAHDNDRRHPLLDHSPGGTHDRFRAVHDIVSHGWLGHDFSRDGEFSAWRAEDRLYRGRARRALATELHAHHSVRWTSGEVAPYKAVLLDPGVLAASREAGRPIVRPGLRGLRRAG